MLCYCCTNSGVSSSRLTSYLNAYFSPYACIGQTVSQIQFLKLTEITEKNFFFFEVTQVASTHEICVV